MRPSGAVENTRNSVEKLCSCTIRMVSMARNMSGKILNSAALALALSSTAPPTSMRMPGGSVAAISSIAGWIWAVTSGA